MKKKQLLSLLLAFAMLMGIAACTAAPAAQTASTEPPSAQTQATEPSAPQTSEAEQPATETAKKITLVVTFEGVAEEIPLETTEETLGAAMIAAGLASGSDSEYGLFVDTVNGHFADAAEGKYWIFTKGGEWVMTGVDATPIADGDSFEWSIYGEEAEPTVEAAKTIRLTITFEGETKEIEIRTNEETLGAALLAEGLISGSDSEYGLFVDTVDGHFADSTKGEYWLFTKGGEWVMTGVDTTPIEDGDAFEWFISVY